MEPILQHLGDVTIQRLDKPKPKPQNDKNNSEKEKIETSDVSIKEGLQGLKRNFENFRAEVKNKKLKVGSTEVSIAEAPKVATSVAIPSEEEISDYETESEFDSENELDAEIAAIKREAAKESSFDGEASFLENSSQDKTSKSETDRSDVEDYEYDIKEKLKEMGEISFETVKKGEKSKKVESASENEVTVLPAKKGGNEDDVSVERKGSIASSMMRRNIREVMDEAKLDESTLAAQRLEMERLQRVQEQQRVIREFQRQVAQERMQNKVFSLLQGGNLSRPGPSGTKIGSTVLVKLPNGETKPMTRIGKRPFELVKLPKAAPPPPVPQRPFPPRNFVLSKRLPPSQGQLTPSVSIAPVIKKPETSSMRPPSDTDSENEDFKYQKPLIPKPRGKEQSHVTTIDLSSDDDCIVISENEGEPNVEERISEEDTANSGMHTNDEFNQPDEQGRVIVNIGHPDGEPDIYLAPQISRIIKPHQIGGVRFLFDNVVESMNRFECSTGFGCILAHSMGLGKTLQVVCFSDVFLRHTSGKTILCIMPINTLQNWLAEYNMWLPKEEDAANSPLSTYGDVRPRNFNLHVLNDSHKTLAARAQVIRFWKAEGGVLLIGYEQYRLLSLRKQPKSRRKPHLVQPEDEDKNRKFFDEVHEALVMPGPDLVICDEGHRIKNSHASISQALKQMRTKRRVVLTGYPLQNNLMEYWCMVDFVRPNYLGSKTEFCNMFERPIQNGQCIDSTETDIKLMRYRAHVLHSLLLGFVQRRSHEVLQTALPQKEEYVLLVRMTTFQRKLYNTFMNEVVRSQTVPNPLKAFAVCCKIWNHPDVLYNFLKKRAGGEAVDIDLEEVSNNSSAVGGEAPGKRRPAARRPAARSRKGAKPAASVTPYNSNATNDEMIPLSSIKSEPHTSQVDSLLDAQFSTDANAPHSFSTQKMDNPLSLSQNLSAFFDLNQQQNPETQKSSSNNYSSSDISNSNFPPNNFQQQNFWSQPNQNNYYPNFSQNSENSREDKKCVIKSEFGNQSCSSETKPKINIISDIKIGKSFLNFSNNKVPPPLDGKKINIISDIKLEVKKEESNDSKFSFESIKNEMKSIQSIPDSNMPPPKFDMRRDEPQDGIPYDWAIDLLKSYIPGVIENSAKMEILFCIIRESIALGDRLLLFSQSLITLDVVEQFLQMNNVPGETERWFKNLNYYRLDGSTSALEREKLINEFNSNPKIHLFLVSTRAGSLGINLVGANRVVVLDASWNPCHDTQAVCRVYRYGQRKPCFVYRFVMDHCLEKKIYDRQINKQGMSDRVVDECNPDAHLTMKDVSTLCFDDAEEDEERDWSCVRDNYIDIVLQKVLEVYGNRFTKKPFQHESLLVDRKDKQLSIQEKRLAKKGYEREKQAARAPAYSAPSARSHRPVASVRPMQQGGERTSRWIPAEHWQRQGMTAEEMTLPLDVVIPTNQPDKGNIILKAGQKVLVLKSPKGVYMQLESGKIVAIKTAIKVRGKAEDDANKLMKTAFPPQLKPPPNIVTHIVSGGKRLVRPLSPGLGKLNPRGIRPTVPNLQARLQSISRKGTTVKSNKFYPMGSEMSPPSNHSRMTFDGMLNKDEEFDGLNDISFYNRKNENQRLPPQAVSIKNEALLQNPQISILKTMQAAGPGPKQRKGPGSAIQQLERSTSAIISETKQRIQDITDVAGSYQEDEKLQSSSETSSLAPLEGESLQDLDAAVEDIEDLDQQYHDEMLAHDPNASDSSTSVQVDGIKTEVNSQDYNNYNGYYSGYNNMQHYPPPPQNYGAYPPQPPPPPPPYDYGYAQPQQPPQYNYGMYPPQGYTTQPPQYPPPPPQYDYTAATHPGYPPYYTQPNPYPPPASPYPTNYPATEYQYNTPPSNSTQNQVPQSNTSYYPNT